MNLRKCLIDGSSVPYRNYPRVGQQAEELYFAQFSTNTGTVIGNGESTLAKVSHLDWDSSILGFACGRANFVASTDHLKTPQLVAQVIEQARTLGIQHLSVRFNAEDTHLIEPFQAAGFDIVDSLVTFTATLDEPSFSTIDNVRFSRPQDAPAVREISRTAFTVDRFHSDPLIPKQKADELHAQWGENSVLGKAADSVVVAEENGQVVGFVTCKIHDDTAQILGVKVGTIVLVATAAEAQGKGYGSQMIQAAMNWFGNQKCHVVDVGTQVSNAAAGKLYERAGFELVGTSVSLRRWI